MMKQPLFANPEGAKPTTDRHNKDRNCHLMASLPIDVNRSGFLDANSMEIDEMLDNSIVFSRGVHQRSSSLATSINSMAPSTDAAADEGAASITRRADLKQAVYRRRKSLTIPETIFLDKLADEGTDSQVRNAVRRLDSGMFEGWEEFDSIDHEDDCGKSEKTSDRESSKDRTHSNGSNGSSVLRLARLADRRNDPVQNQLWTAHASGVFRPVRQRSKSISVMTSTPPPRPFGSHSNLKRASTGRRKSVTFHRSVSSAAAVSGNKRGGIMRSNSVSSTPSIRPATAIRSDSMASNGSGMFLPSMPSINIYQRTTSTSSIPSIRPATALRSDSMSSMLSFVGNDPAAARISTTERIADMWAQMGQQRRETFISDNANALFDDSTMSISEAISRSPSMVAMESPSTKPVLVRLASHNKDAGQGVEVLDATPTKRGTSMWRRQSSRGSIGNMPTIGGLRRSLSDDEISYDPAATLLLQSVQLPASIHAADEFDDDASWDMMSDGDNHHFDAWEVMHEEGNGYAENLDFKILGTSAKDIASVPHVLSPPLLESLSAFLPESLTGQNFLMKYSLVRDGAHINTFLKHARGSDFTILALETVEGEVFGSFTSQAWRKNWNYFGAANGRDSFLWKMRRNRMEKCSSVFDQANMESEIDVFPYTGANELVQLCTHDRVAVGGGTTNQVTTIADNRDWRTEKNEDIVPLSPKSMESSIQPHEWGFGLCLDENLLSGTTSPCLTFDNPSLSRVHSDGSRFEVINAELWTLTPCATTEDALALTLAKLFFTTPQATPESSPHSSPRKAM